jgi:hypothetical protein
LFAPNIYIADAVISAWEKFCREKADAASWRLANEQFPSDWDRVFLSIQLAAWRIAAGLLAGFIAGYVSHLVLDAGTVSSLPWFGLKLPDQPLRLGSTNNSVARIPCNQRQPQQGFAVRRRQRVQPRLTAMNAAVRRQQGKPVSAETKIRL